MDFNEKELNISADDELDAFGFLREIRREKLTSRQFLTLIGNSKIDNETYNKIEANPRSTVYMLGSLLSESTLTSEDYREMLREAREQFAQNDEFVSEESVQTEQAAQPEPIEEQPEKKSVGGKAAIDRIAMTAFSQSRQRLNDLDLGHPDKTLLLTKPERTEKAPVPEEKGLKIKRPSPLMTTADVAGRRKEIEDAEPEERPHYATADEFDDESTNTGKIVMCFIFAIILAAVSFGVRYMQTGSFLLTEEEIITVSAPENSAELFELMAGMSAESASAPSYKEYYSVGKADEKPLFDTSVTDGSFICSINGKHNTMVDIVPIYGSELSFSIIDAGFEVKGVMLSNGALLVLGEGTEKTEFSYEEKIGTDADGKDVFETKSGFVEKPIVKIAVYDPASPSNTPAYTYSQSGTLSEMKLVDNRLVILTDDKLYDGAKASAEDSFFPYITENGTRHSVAFEAINAVKGAKYSNITVIGSFTAGLDAAADAPAACIGGKTTSAYFNGKTLYLIKDEGGSTDIVKYGVAGEIKLLADANVSGTVPSADFVNENGGVLRVFSEQAGKEPDNEKTFTLTLLDSLLSPVSLVENLAPGKPISGAAFDSELAYIISDEAEEVFAIDTTVPDELLIAHTIKKTINSDDCYGWSESRRLGFARYSDELGASLGLKLSMNSLDESNVMTENASILLSAEAGVSQTEENLNDYLTSAAETDRSALSFDAEKGLVAVPITYFDGISEIEKVVLFTYDDALGFEKAGEIAYYDMYYGLRRTFIVGDKLYSVWNSRVIEANLSDMTVSKTLEIDY